jgi:hypothetical protein
MLLNVCFVSVFVFQFNANCRIVSSNAASLMTMFFFEVKIISTNINLKECCSPCKTDLLF